MHFKKMKYMNVHCMLASIWCQACTLYGLYVVQLCIYMVRIQYCFRDGQIAYPLVMCYLDKRFYCTSIILTEDTELNCAQCIMDP